MRKKIIPCIYLKDETAISYFNDDTVISDDPVSLAVKYSESLCDEIIIFDLSNEDSEHEKALDVIKDICSNVKVPVTGAGNVKRMEDIKKLLYAGCKKAILNFSRNDNVELAKEVSDKFGVEKITACIKETSEYSDNLEVIDKYIGDLLFLDVDILKNIDLSDEKRNVIVALPEVSLDKLIEAFKICENMGLSGKVINDNTEQYTAIKELICNKIQYAVQ